MTKKVWVNLGEAHERLKGLHSCGAVNPDWKAAWGPPPPDPLSDWATRDRRFWVIGTPASCGRITVHSAPLLNAGVLASRTSYRMRRSSAATGKGCALSECRKTEMMWKTTFEPPEGRLPLYSLQPAGLVMAVKSAAAEREMSQAAVVREALMSYLAAIKEGH